MKDFWAKLSKFLLFCFLLLVPTQLGRHFWPEWSYVLGIRIDYLSPTLYLIDLFWWGLFFVENRKARLRNLTHFSLKKFLIFLFIVINVLVAENKMVSVYGWFRLFQVCWMIWFFRRNKELVKKFLFIIIPVWVVLEGWLTIGQISKGGSLNGWWWWLGERSFEFNTIGVAQMSLVGNALVRAYGTFSHPNSLAGFMLVSWMWWWKYKPALNKEVIFKKNIGVRIFWWMVFWMALTVILLTGSRTVWFLTLIALFCFIKTIFLNNRNWWKVLVLFFLLVIVIIKIIDFNYPINNFLSGWDENGLIKRGQLNLISLNMIKESPIFGVGMKNYLVRLPDFQKNDYIFWLQPVHNILLLLLSEIGFLGLIILIWVLSGWFKKTKLEWNNLVLIGVILLTGMMDHYWLTLPQNIWLLTILLGII